MSPHTEKSEEQDKKHTWRNWYVIVIVWHILVILMMYLFTLSFHPAV